MKEHRLAETVLQVGSLPSALAEAVNAKYDMLPLPTEYRDGFLRRTRRVGSKRSSTPVNFPSTPNLLAALPNLGAIIHHGDGYDTVDVDAAQQLGIGLSNTPDVLTDTSPTPLSR